MVLTLDFNDRTSDLIDEAMDLAIRVSTELAPGIVARKLSQGRLFTVASPGYLAQHGTPEHPDDLLHHRCLGYTGRAHNRPLLFQVNGQAHTVAPPYVLQANNGDALALAAEQGMGVTTQPDFIVEEALASGTLQPILQDFAPAAVWHLCRAAQQSPAHPAPAGGDGLLAQALRPPRSRGIIAGFTRKLLELVQLAWIPTPIGSFPPLGSWRMVARGSGKRICLSPPLFVPLVPAPFSSLSHSLGGERHAQRLYPVQRTAGSS